MQEVHVIVEVEERVLPAAGGAAPVREPFWRVSVTSHEPFANGRVARITDEELAAIPGMNPRVTTWRKFGQHLTPRAAWRPPVDVLQRVGGLLWGRLVSDPEVREHIQKVEGGRGGRALRYVLELRSNNLDDLLDDLPFELAFREVDHVFRRNEHPALRGVPRSPARNVRLSCGSHVLVVTAHDDHEPYPTAAELVAHTAELATVITRAGWTHEPLADATSAALRERLRRGGVDLLYVVCHGNESSQTNGMLSLRDRIVTGAELSDWLDDAARATPERPVQLAMLTACSSAAPGKGGTSGMAQHVARANDKERARAALGYRGPVGVDWAIRFAEYFFDDIRDHHDIDRACAAARRRSPIDDPQWALPVLFSRRADPEALASSVVRTNAALESVAPPARFRGLGLLRSPRSYFVARVEELRALRAWLTSPGVAAITAVEGEGGVGKSELALQFAAEVQAKGRPVLWLPVRGMGVREGLLQLIQAVEPDYRPGEATSDEALAAVMRSKLSGHGGLLVLDDVATPALLDPLTPGANWNVLLTTRERHLRADVERVTVDVLYPADALLLLSRVVWSAEAPPEAQREAAARLVERLWRLPMAIEIAGGLMRHQLLGAQEYLDALGVPDGAVAESLQRVQTVLTWPLDLLGDLERHAFLALGVGPAVGGRDDELAMVLGVEEVKAGRSLDRLVHWHLATRDLEQSRVMQHPLLREAARAKARRDPDVWNALHLGVAIMLQRRIEDARRSINEGRPGDALARWLLVRDLFITLDRSAWEAGAPGRAQLADALHLATLMLYEAVEDKLGQANVLRAHGELQRRQDDLAGAAADYAAALTLYEAVEDKLGQANVLMARGELRHRQDHLTGAADDYEAALTIFEAVEARRGQANVLRARGELRHRQNDLVGAAADYEAALTLYETGGDKLGQANVLKARADLRRRQDDLAGAAANYAAALTLYEAGGDKLGQANVLKAHGDLRRRQDDLAGAGANYAAALTLYEAGGDKLGQANVLRSRGELRHRQDDRAGAAVDYEAALALFEAGEDKLGRANVLKARGDLRHSQDDHAGAAADYAAALTLYEAVDARLGQANVLKARGDMAQAQQVLPDAMMWYEQALALYKSAGDRLGLSNVLAEVAQVQLMMGAIDNAEEAAIQALDFGRQAQNAYARSVSRRVFSLIEKLRDVPDR